MSEELHPYDPEPPRPEWTVEADGWRLVIEDGAITGLVRAGVDVEVRPRWYPPLLTC